MKDENTAALKDRAEQLFGAGKFRRSLKVYEELIRREQADPRLRVRRGELKRRLAANLDAAHDYLAAAKLYAAQGYGARARAALRIAEDLAPFDEQVVKANLVTTPVPAAKPANVLGVMKRREAIELGADTSFWDHRPELPSRLALPEGTDLWDGVPEGREEPHQAVKDPGDQVPDLLPEDEFQRMHGL